MDDSNNTNHLVKNTTYLQKSISASILNSVYYYAVFIICTIGIINNVLVIATTNCSRKLRISTAGILIVALSFTDAVLVIMKIMSHIFQNHFKQELPGCWVFYYMESTVQSISHLLILVISLNRYALVCHPLSHTRVTARKSVMKQILLVIFLVFTGNLVMLFSKTPKDFYQCYVPKYAHISYYIWVWLIYILLYGIIPTAVIFFLSIRVVYTLKKSRRFIRDDVVCLNKKKRMKAERQITWSLMAVTVMFIFLRLPFLICYTLIALHMEAFKVGYSFTVIRNIVNATKITELFSMGNYAINLYLYCYFSALFRQTFRRFLQCKKEEPAIDFNSDNTKYIQNDGHTNVTRI